MYQNENDVDLKKVRVSEGVIANKHDARYAIGYEVEPGKIVPLYVKNLRDCPSSGVTRYNGSSPWKMGFKVGKYKVWIQQYEAIWWKICEFLHASVCVYLSLVGN